MLSGCVVCFNIWGFITLFYDWSGKNEIVGTLFFLAYLSWFIKDIKTKKALAVATANSTQVASAEQAKEENIKEETKSNVDLDSGLNKIESKTTKKSSTKSIKDNRSNKTNKN